MHINCTCVFLKPDVEIKLELELPVGPINSIHLWMLKLHDSRMSDQGFSGREGEEGREGGEG